MLTVTEIVPVKIEHNFCERLIISKTKLFFVQTQVRNYMTIQQFKICSLGNKDLKANNCKLGKLDKVRIQSKE